MDKAIGARPNSLQLPALAYIIIISDFFKNSRAKCIEMLNSKVLGYVPDTSALQCTRERAASYM